ncbi:Zinc transporter 4 [Liparis tanakae]|uniref:Zinc transporter 4 n=1 Tax=Liparis tanakae TaxID=230148 RepID=A0A4Z2E3L7_9TELE|nr:Zinc transporter 4 [Liparis tanakae]
MAGGGLLSKVRCALRGERGGGAERGDEAPFDFSDELVEDEAPKFNKLKVVVSGEMSDYSSGAPSNGLSTLAVADDDDCLLDPSGPGGPGLHPEPCDTCGRKRERLKNKRVMKRLVLAAMLYFSFMTAEIVGKHV